MSLDIEIPGNEEDYGLATYGSKTLFEHSESSISILVDMAGQAENCISFGERSVLYFISLKSHRRINWIWPSNETPS